MVDIKLLASKNTGVSNLCRGYLEGCYRVHDSWIDIVLYLGVFMLKQRSILWLVRKVA